MNSIYVISVPYLLLLSLLNSYSTKEYFKQSKIESDLKCWKIKKSHQNIINIISNECIF